MADQTLILTRPARPGWLDRTVISLLAAAVAVAILVTGGIVLSLVFETLQFFKKVPVADFLFGLNWSPQTAIRADQVGSAGSFGALPLINGTLLISAIAMRWQRRLASLRRFTCLNMPAKQRGPGANRRLSFSRAFQRWFTGSSPHSPSPRSFA
jgi:hypothetical protein